MALIVRGTGNWESAKRMCISQQVGGVATGILRSMEVNQQTESNGKTAQ